MTQWRSPVSIYMYRTGGAPPYAELTRITGPGSRNLRILSASKPAFFFMRPSNQSRG